MSEARGVRPAWLLPVYFVGALLCLLVRPEWASLLAPFAGPWAGRLYGHVSCTMASVYPTASWVTAAFLPVAMAVAWVGRRYAVAILPLLVWCLAWAALAWVSVVNSTS